MKLRYLATNGGSISAFATQGNRVLLLVVAVIVLDVQALYAAVILLPLDAA